VLLIAPATTRTWQGARLAGLQAVLGGRAEIVRVAGDLRKLEAQIEDALGSVRGAVGLDRATAVALGNVLKRSGRPLPAGGFDLLPNDLALVTGGQLAFVVDQQPYLQGFSPVMQLFLARISEGTVTPSGAETSILLRKADVQPFVATKSRFEGSSSRHEYPLRRA
jgi:ABC-type sugar transport system substrate-binding protein